MFSFWNPDHRVCEPRLDIEASLQPQQPQQHRARGAAVSNIAASETPKPLKRRRPSFDDPDELLLSEEESVKRARIEDSACEVSTPEETATVGNDAEMAGRVRDVIEHQLGLEILHKHDELRLINQELAKCQVALEQLRRCHLIPYPTCAPTPAEMLNIAAGKGPAVQSKPGQVPRWAPPFGITEGPYARHYAKWLIPDPVFDGVEPEWQFTAEAAKARASFSEGRLSRNHVADPWLSNKRRPSRANAGAKLQALSNGYPQPKDKSGPCVLKRSDGKTVKLVCLDCHRENFSSTQGFINHCRIAHKRLFESHDHAAMQSGQPLDSDETTAALNKQSAQSSFKIAEKPATPVTANSAPTTCVHPFARSDMTDQEACAALKTRLAASMAMFRSGELQNAPPLRASSSDATLTNEAQSSFTGSADTPYLSKLLKHRKFNGSLGNLVRDAKTRISYEDITPDEESDEPDSDIQSSRALGTTRMPARAPPSPALRDSSKHPKNGLSFHLRHPRAVSDGALSRDTLEDDLDMTGVNLSPNTLISNNAPSLVSDDGEYEDSDDVISVSGHSEAIDEESDTDVAEITMVDDQEPQTIARRPSTVPCRQEDKHVTFMAPVEPGVRRRKRRRV